MSDSPWNPRAEDGMEWATRRGLGELNERMGIELVEFTVDRAVATMPVVGNRQPALLLHGGAYAVMGETLGSFSANFWAGPNRFAVGVDINATHTRSATDGMVTGVCTPIHLGGSMTVHEIVISDEAGRRCSTVRITNLLRDRGER
ncbi:MAG: PaaI family thioesterase [Agromyces sp.]